MFGYRREKSTGHVIDYFDLPFLPEETADYEFVLCEESEKPDLYKEEIVRYDPIALIEWAFANLPDFIGSSHEAIFVKFAEDPVKYKDLIMQRAVALDAINGVTLGVDTVNIILAKARDLGAEV